jgi:hypothetical protein
LIESGSDGEQSDYSAMMRDMIGPNLMTQIFTLGRLNKSL